MQINLETFCDKNRTQLNKPWSSGEHSYACNGIIIVRIKKEANISENEAAPQNLAEIIKQPTQPEWKPVPKTHGDDQIDCRHCKGSGTHYCHECDTMHECGKCKGSGIEDAQTTIEPGLKMRNKHLRLLHTLEEIRWAKIDETRFYFQFAEGDGVACARKLDD